MSRDERVLVGLSKDGFASLLDMSTGTLDASLRLPPPDHLRSNTEEETAAYAKLVTRHDLCTLALFYSGTCMRV